MFNHRVKRHKMRLYGRLRNVKAIYFFLAVYVVLAVWLHTYMSPLGTPLAPTYKPFTRYTEVKLPDSVRDIIKKHDDPSNDDDVRLAFLLLVHSKQTCEGAGRLLRRLYHIKHTFAIHLDRDAGVPNRECQDLVLKYFDVEMRALMMQHNVFMFTRHSVQWGGISIVQAEIDLIQLASQRHWDYAFILSGRDYPICKISTLYETVRALRGPRELRAKFDPKDYDRFVEISDVMDTLPEPNRLLISARLSNLTDSDLTYPVDFPSLFAKTGMYWVNLMANNGYGGVDVPWKNSRLEWKVCVERPGDRKINCALRGFRSRDQRVVDIAPYLKWGTQWVTLSRPFCDWVLNSAFARNFLVLATNMEIPDETYFQTLAFASKWRDHSVWEPATFPMPMRQEHWDLIRCGTGPCSFTKEDLIIILNGGRVDPPETKVDKFSRPSVSLFGRKFDPEDDFQYNFVDKWLYNEVLFGPNQQLVTITDTWWWE